MGMRKLEAEILRQLRAHEGNHRIRQKDIMAWALGDNLTEVARADETVVRLTDIFGSRCIVAYRKSEKG